MGDPLSPDTAKPDTAEMAHVLFMDLVGYSKLSSADQVRLQQLLLALVQANSEYKKASSQEQLITLPTGDGMALVFFRDPVSPVRCAVELSKQLRSHPELQLRMGVHSGLVYRVADINANLNVAGGGINIAQRVMDCGNAGHILVSATVAGVLQEEGSWKDSLQDLGEVEVKHGARVRLFNLSTADAGNGELPEKLKRAHSAGKKFGNPGIILLLTLIALLAGTGYLLWRKYGVGATPPQVVGTLRLSYSFRTLANPEKYPNAKEESFPGEIIFTPGDQLRISFVGSEPAFLYLINEGPKPENGLPRYNLLFPGPDLGDGATLKANQPLYLPQERPPWFRVDAEQGTETLWVVESRTSIPELETCRKWLTRENGGKVASSEEISAIRSFLTHNYSDAKPVAEKDELQTNLKGNGKGLLIHAIRLAHR